MFVMMGYFHVLIDGRTWIDVRHSVKRTEENVSITKKQPPVNDAISEVAKKGGKSLAGTT